MSTPAHFGWIAHLTERFLGHFPEDPPAVRTIGREAEHPVVNADGTAARVSLLWPILLEMGDYEIKREGDLIVELVGDDHRYALEVGYGTVEIITAPAEDLHGIRDIYERALARLIEAANTLQMTILGYGMQPLTPASVELMSDKPRYFLLYEVLGEGWLSFTQSASDQVHVAVGRHEAAPLTTLLNILSPVVIAICASSPICGGVPTGHYSAREAKKGLLQSEYHRHGMPEAPMGHLGDLIGAICRMPFLMTRHGDEVARFDGTFLDYLESIGGVKAPGAWEQFLVHDHYVWHTARPRSVHGTIELRCAGQQPGDAHMVVAALTLGMVEAAAELATLLDSRLGEEAWPAMVSWHERVISQGIGAVEPNPGLLSEVLTAIRHGLVNRGRGEEVYLQPAFDRVAALTNPAEEALDAFAVGGIPALIDRFRLV